MERNIKENKLGNENLESVLRKIYTSMDASFEEKILKSSDLHKTGTKSSQKIK